MRNSYLKSGEQIARQDDGLRSTWTSAHTTNHVKTITVRRGGGQVVLDVSSGDPADPVRGFGDLFLALPPWAAQHLACLLVRTADALVLEGER